MVIFNVNLSAIVPIKGSHQDPSVDMVVDRFTFKDRHITLLLCFIFILKTCMEQHKIFMGLPKTGVSF